MIPFRQKLFLKILADQTTLDTVVPEALLHAIYLLKHSEKDEQDIFTQEHEIKFVSLLTNLGNGQNLEYQAIFLHFTGPVFNSSFNAIYQNIFKISKENLANPALSPATEVQAKFNLAFLYQNKLGLPNDENTSPLLNNQAFTYYKFSADAGHFLAQFYFAKIYEDY